MPFASYFHICSDLFKKQHCQCSNPLCKDIHLCISSLFLFPGGEIPDAKTIHFIRKQRQMARQSEDYLPIEQSEAVASKNSSTSRLVR